MKQKLQQIINELIATNWGGEPFIEQLSYQLTATNKPEHGDYATNIALVIAKKLQQNPLALAENLVGQIQLDSVLVKVEIAGPGFINFFFAPKVYQQELNIVLSQGDNYGRLNIGQQQQIHLEFVSVNPTGPLHVGHGRNAAYGSALANCLEAVGYQVHREYYVNDAGRQMDILTVSVYLRYLELHDEIIKFPVNGYQGGYIFDIARLFIQEVDDRYFQKASAVLFKLPNDANEEDGDGEQHIDALITRCKMLLGEDHYLNMHQFVLNNVLTDIKQDLERFKVEQHYFSEQSLIDQNSVEDVLDLLHRKEAVYEQDHAIWFKATKFGDDKDRVLKKANGHYTYFATDIANHYHKYLTDYTKIIDVFGADHHGYIARMNAAIMAMNLDIHKFQIKLVQFATLFRGTVKVQMSTRSGSFITLKELIDEVGVDAARFFYLMRKSEQHMDFDIELAKSKTADNPVYYIQYAHARICSVLRQAQAKDMGIDLTIGLANVELLQSPMELTLLKMLAKYPEILAATAEQLAPHMVAQYLKELAGLFHAYYGDSTFLVDDSMQRNARLCLIMGVKQILNNGLLLLGISRPEQM